MSYRILQAIAATHWSIYFMFAYLAYASFLATKPKIIPLKSFYFLLVMFIALTSLAISTMIHVTSVNAAYYAGTLALGVSLGWLQCTRLKVAAIEGKKQFRIQGSYIFGILIFTLIVARYVYFTELDISVESFKTPFYSDLMMGFYGLFTGLVIGRLLYMKRVLKFGPFILNQRINMRWHTVF